MLQFPGRFPRIAVVLALVLTVGICAFAQGGSIRRHYVWEYGGRVWSFAYDFSSSIYEQQKSLARTLDYMAYGVYVVDARDDDVLRDFLARLEKEASGFTVWERLNWVIALIQSIPYASEPSEYPRYPVETLVDQRGDCEDMAILTAALVRQMGFGVVLLAYVEEGHMAVGIRVLPPSHQTLQAYEWNGDMYYYLESTSTGWSIGQVPFADLSQPVIIGVGSVVATRQP